MNQAAKPADPRPAILVVDDTRVNLMLTCSILEHHFHVLPAASGVEALRIASATPNLDLVLLDVMMPDMDGYEVLRRLRAQPATRDIPVVFVTAMVGDEDEERGLRLGAVDYVPKPLRPAILLARVRNHVELKRARDQMRSQNDFLEARVHERTTALRRMLEHQQALNHKLEEAQNQLLQSEKMASLGQLAAGVAHELNNPIGFVHSNLGTLEGYLADLFNLVEAYEKATAAVPSAELKAALTPAQALRKTMDYDFVRQDIHQLMNESRDGLSRVKKIVQDLKDFSRVGETNWQWADLHQGLDSTLNIVWNELKYKCTVTKHYAPSLPRIRCLPSQLNQVFMNLLVNAAHAIPDKGEITISTEALGEDRVRVRIADTGAGIPAENLKRIFEPFFTTKPVGKGTGLGLSIAWGIVGKHHGSIEVDSQPGAGTTFTITLPVDPPVNDGTGSPSREGAVPPSSTSATGA